VQLHAILLCRIFCCVAGLNSHWYSDPSGRSSGRWKTSYIAIDCADEHRENLGDWRSYWYV